MLGRVPEHKYLAPIEMHGVSRTLWQDKHPTGQQLEAREDRKWQQLLKLKYTTEPPNKAQLQKIKTAQLSLSVGKTTSEHVR